MEDLNWTPAPGNLFQSSPVSLVNHKDLQELSETDLPFVSDWSANSQALKWPSWLEVTSMVVSGEGQKHMAVILSSWGAETVVLSTKLRRGRNDMKKRRK